MTGSVGEGGFSANSYMDITGSSGSFREILLEARGGEALEAAFGALASTFGAPGVTFGLIWEALGVNFGNQVKILDLSETSAKPMRK